MLEEAATHFEFKYGKDNEHSQKARAEATRLLASADFGQGL